MRCLRVRLFSSTVLLWLGMLCTTANAQAPLEEPYAVGMDGVPLQQALKAFARLAHIDLVYSSELVAGRQTACTTALEARTVEDGLRCLLAGTGLGFVHSTSGAYVLRAEAPPDPRRGSLSGVVVDAETGAPLPRADVRLAGAGLGTSTDTAGVFRFSDVLAGPHRIVVSYVGYAPEADSVWIAARGQQPIRVTLQAVPQALAPIVVDGEAGRPSPRASGIVELKALAALPGTRGLDALRLAGDLAGVTAPEPLADLHIQGGASGEHLLLLDGVPVRNPVSLGRYYGAFSPLALKRLTVHKAGFEAAYGSVLAGAVALEHDIDGQDGRGMALSLDPVSLNGRVQGRWSSASGERLVAMAALRTSIWSVYQDAGTQELLSNSRTGAPALAYPWLTSSAPETPSRWPRHGPGAAFPPLGNEEPLVAFSDFHAAARMTLSPSQVAYGSLYHGSNYLAIAQEAPGVDGAVGGRASHLQEAHQWRNWAGQLRYSWAVSERSVATVHLQESWHDARYAWQAHTGAHGPEPEDEDADGKPVRFHHPRVTPYASEHNLLDEFSLRAELSHALSPRRHVQAGLALDRTASAFQLGNRFIAPFTYRAAAWDAAGYVQGTFGLGGAFTLAPSLRLTWLAPRRRLYAEPRLALHYDHSWGAGGAFGLRLAGGVYRQFTNQFELSSADATSLVPSMLFWLPAAPDVAPPRAYHATAEAALAPDAHWSFNADVYFKAQSRLLMLDYARLVTNPAGDASVGMLPTSLAQHDFLVASRGRAYGGSLQVRWTGTPVSSALTYSFSQALRQYPGRFEDRMLPVPWNEPHRLALSASAPLPSRLALDVDWTGSWGRRWELNQAYYDYAAAGDASSAATALDLARPDLHRLPVYYQLDLGLSFEQTWRPGAMHFQIGVLNVLNRHNVYDQILLATDAGTLAAQERMMPGRHVTFSILLKR